MKNLWLIAVVVFSFFACNEKKEQELTPIYADAFYEPDFIPYLMLKHGVDTIKVIDSAMQTTWKWKDKDSMLSSIFTFNRETKLSKFFPLVPMPNNEYAMFGEDSLLRYVTYGSCSPICYIFNYERQNDKIIRIAAPDNFSFFNDSLKMLFNRDSLIPRSQSEIKLVDGKVSEFFNGYFIIVDSSYSKREFKQGKLHKVLRYNIMNESGIIDTLIKTFFWGEKELHKIEMVAYKRGWFEDVNHKQSSVLYFKDNLPSKRIFYYDEDSLVLHYQIIRNAKK